MRLTGLPGGETVTPGAVVTSQSASSRGPYCMMGVCFDCLVEINGLPNQQACMIKAKSGMTVNRQIGPPSHGLSKVGGRSIK